MTRDLTPDWPRICATLARAVAATFPNWRVKMSIDTGLLHDGDRLLPDLVLSDGFRLAICVEDHLAIGEVLSRSIARATTPQDRAIAAGHYPHRIPVGEAPMGAHARLALAQDLDALGLDAARTMGELAAVKDLIDTA